MTCDPTMVPAPHEVDIPSLRTKYREERDRRLRPDGQEQYAAAFQETEAARLQRPAHDSVVAPMPSATTSMSSYLVVVGPAFSPATTCERPV